MIRVAMMLTVSRSGYGVQTDSTSVVIDDDEKVYAVADIDPAQFGSSVAIREQVERTALDALANCMDRVGL